MFSHTSTALIKSVFAFASLLISTFPAMAASVITEPGDLEVRGHGPEPDALMNHYALENSTPFQIRIIRGVCSSSSNLCIGGADDGMVCAVTTDCASGPLTFISGETEYYDVDGNSVAGPFPSTSSISRRPRILATSESAPQISPSAAADPEMMTRTAAAE